MPDTTEEVIRQEKQRLRREGIAKRRAMTPDAVRRGGEIIAARVLALPEVRRAPLVLSYVEKPGMNEVPTSPIIEALLAERKAVAVPRVEGEHLIWQSVDGLAGLVSDVFGVPTPEKDDRLVIRHYPPGTVCLVPGLWWTDAGYRLGYGKGYFDRFLLVLKLHSIGLGWKESVIGDLPIEPHDQAVEVVITDA
ncbi:MAG: 5-formyltetrahydrofolate cyclo-ligase [Candidatus Hydrogenedens sp.]|nr:5-formyltetrahydrofolate cyclo-ligase [Candidatus Hydrogenedens sp.]